MAAQSNLFDLNAVGSLVDRGLPGVLILILLITLYLVVKFLQEKPNKDANLTVFKWKAFLVIIFFALSLTCLIVSFLSDSRAVSVPIIIQPSGGSIYSLIGDSSQVFPTVRCNIDTKPLKAGACTLHVKPGNVVSIEVNNYLDKIRDLNMLAKRNGALPVNQTQRDEGGY